MNAYIHIYTKAYQNQIAVRTSFIDQSLKIAGKRHNKESDQKKLFIYFFLRELYKPEDKKKDISEQNESINLELYIHQK